ncbi:MAG TPA: ATP-dependent DNA helicase RecG [Candidatus Paceibacterota bacterium]
MLDLLTPIEKLPKVGPKNLPRLKRLGIKTVKDLLWHFPSRYEDFTQTVGLGEVGEVGKVISIIGEVAKIKTTNIWRRRMSITEAHIKDGDEQTRAVWFNQPYIENSLVEGSLVSLSGKVALDKRGIYLSSPSYEKIFETKIDLVHTGRLVPVYPETEGISSRYLRFLIKPLLGATDKFSDHLPENVRKKYNFPSLDLAIKTIHFPESLEEAGVARKRVAFDELLLFQIKSLLGRRGLSKLKAPSVIFKPELVKGFVGSLPFVLTNDQRVCAFEIMKDFGRSYPMNRLLNGDVGSGKTIVAIIAACQTANSGFQTVFMAPTEILAQQHYATIKSLLGRLRTRVGLLTGSEAKQWPIDEVTEEKISKNLMQKKISNGEIDIVVGTHAVIQKDVKFKNLGLIIIDEQHRFGVKQRMQLVKGQGTREEIPAKQYRHWDAQSPAPLTPHLLSMTATPIPRTLALTIYGDLDVSLIKEKPKDRKKIITKVFAKDKSAEVYGFVEKEILSGRQTFVICPRIELSNPQEAVKTSAQQNKMNILWAEVKAVTTEYEKLSQKVFPNFKIAMLHGKMKPKEKEKIMEDFKNGKYQILVSTSVVEVGVDVPNATVMLIENAERFGLSQLHQFRGRVGRAEHQSYCFLVNGGNNRFENKRLRALEISDDGFKLAEQDLLLRGPGEFVGTKQSGLPDLAMASLTDLDLIKKARLEAKLLLKEDPNLKSYPALKNQLAKFQKIRHFE